MNKKAEELVKAIGEEIIEKLNKLEDDFDYEYDEDGLYKASYGVSLTYNYGNSCCDIECSVDCKMYEVECCIYGNEGIHKDRYKNLECLEYAVNDYLEKNLDISNLRILMEEKVRESYEDEWESHGFRNAADYYSYRYG